MEQVTVNVNGRVRSDVQRWYASRVLDWRIRSRPAASKYSLRAFLPAANVTPSLCLTLGLSVGLSNGIWGLLT
jgi:hypothetical protein